MGYHVTDGIVEQHYPDAPTAAGAAKRYVREGVDVSRGACIETVRVWADGEDEGGAEDVTVVVDQTEPTCPEGEHRWEDLGVVGHGGGVIRKDVCASCGCVRVTDSWAQDPVTGREGFRTVGYEVEP